MARLATPASTSACRFTGSRISIARRRVSAITSARGGKGSPGEPRSRAAGNDGPAGLMSDLYHALEFVDGVRQDDALGHRSIERVPVALVNHAKSRIANQPILADDAFELRIDIDQEGSFYGVRPGAD